MVNQGNSNTTPAPSQPWHQKLTAAEYLELAGVALERQAAQVLCGGQARQLQALAEIFDVLALKLRTVEA